MKQYRWLFITLLAALAFAATTRQNWRTNLIVNPPQFNDHVVIGAPLQVLMYGGDRFLAANLEAMRLATLASANQDNDMALYLIRAHHLVAELNPCHEDNYYLSNVLLSWAGANEEGDKVLLQATECRHWDWMPPFFYSINQYFFRRDNTEAQRAMNIAAARSSANSAVLKKSAIMMAAGEIDDERLALNYLRQQRDSSTDKKLQAMLTKRIVRLEGLLTLRNAQQRYETETGRKLTNPQDIVTGGYLAQPPSDPLGLGYMFEDGVFKLRKRVIAGMEQYQ